MTGPNVIFPDAVLVAKQIIEAGFAAAGITNPVHGRVPTDRPTRFTTIRLNGGDQRDAVTDGPRLVVESWAADEPTAHDDAQRCRAWLRAARGTSHAGQRIGTVTAPTPVNFPDPLSRQIRFVQYPTIALRGASL